MKQTGGRTSGPSVPLIPREVLFGNPEKLGPSLSPDGRYLAYLAPDQRNVLQVWLRTLGKEDDRKLTDDEKRGIHSYFWTLLILFSTLGGIALFGITGFILGPILAAVFLTVTDIYASEYREELESLTYDGTSPSLSNEAAGAEESGAADATPVDKPPQADVDSTKKADPSEKENSQESLNNNP